jgi:hypothetical protein
MKRENEQSENQMNALLLADERHDSEENHEGKNRQRTCGTSSAKPILKAYLH